MTMHIHDRRITGQGLFSRQEQLGIERVQACTR